jgi:hypothetical protein
MSAHRSGGSRWSRIEIAGHAHLVCPINCGKPDEQRSVTGGRENPSSQWSLPLLMNFIVRLVRLSRGSLPSTATMACLQTDAWYRWQCRESVRLFNGAEGQNPHFGCSRQRQCRVDCWQSDRFENRRCTQQGTPLGAYLLPHNAELPAAKPQTHGSHLCVSLLAIFSSCLLMSFRSSPLLDRALGGRSQGF